jgi:hypothetical protein
MEIVHVIHTNLSYAGASDVPATLLAMRVERRTRVDIEVPLILLSSNDIMYFNSSSCS